MTDDELHRSFVEAILNDPDDEDARTVYADWLEQRGDPRGEYVRLEQQLVRIPARLATLAESLPADWLDAIGRRYDIVLTASGTSKIMTIVALRSVTGLGLADAKDLVDSVGPTRSVVIRENVERKAAEQIIAAFKDTDASLYMLSRGRNAKLVLDPTTDVVLMGGIDATNRVQAVNAVRRFTALDLAEAHAVVERNTRYVLAHNVPPARAREILEAFAGIAEVVLERPIGQ